MIWLAWFMLALESMVIAIGLWLMWVMVSEASRAPADPFPQVEDLPERSPVESLEHPPEASGDPALFTLEDVDERGYVNNRKLHMGCEAAVCRTPLGARIVAGRRSLEEPQYAWDYASVRLADKALAYAEFNTHPGRASSASTISGVAPIRQQNPVSTCVAGDIPPRDKWRGSD